MRKLLLLSAAFGAIAVGSAQAAPVLSYQILDGSTVIGSGSSANGSIAISGSDTTFSISGAASGAPFLQSPNFSTNNFTMSSGAAGGTITIKVTETGLTSFNGNIVNTFTLNSLTAPSFTTGTIANYFDATNTAFGTGTLLGTVTYSGSDSFSSQRSTSATMPGTFSETTIYTLSFNSGSSSSMSSSAQLVATPEPASLAIVGAGLAAVGFIRRRRRAA